jgi:cytochrome P450
VQDLIDEFKTFLFAGTDTTSNSTSILIYHIAKNKEIEKKLRK